MNEERSELVSVAGIDLDLRTLGAGPRVVFLHGNDGLLFCEPFLRTLSEQFEVIVPSHPGFEGTPRTPRFRTLDDVAYVYLDLLGGLEGPVHLVGCSIGAWLAMEVATKCSHAITSLALVAPIGIRTGPPTMRYYLDLYASPEETVAAALYGDAASRPDLSTFDEQHFERLAAAQEATTLYAWQPYMHNPALLDRLAGVRVPTLLVEGDRDGLVLADDHLDTIASHLGGETELASVAGAGHRVEEEAPEELSEILVKFFQSH